MNDSIIFVAIPSAKQSFPIEREEKKDNVTGMTS
jgi:hypothetical protein